MNKLEVFEAIAQDDLGFRVAIEGGEPLGEVAHGLAEGYLANAKIRDIVAALATVAGWKFRAEGVVAPGAQWRVYDEAGETAVEDIPVTEDPTADDYDGSWLDDDQRERTIVLEPTWRLAIVDWDGEARDVEAYTRTVVPPIVPECEGEGEGEGEHEFRFVSARGDGADTVTYEACEVCGLCLATRTGRDPAIKTYFRDE